VVEVIIYFDTLFFTVITDGLYLIFIVSFTVIFPDQVEVALIKIGANILCSTKLQKQLPITK